MTIHLARHGQTAYNHEGRFQGHLPVPLDATGREQAAALAEVAAGVEIASLWCSPLRRARETADVVLKQQWAPATAARDAHLAPGGRQGPGEWRAIF
jgi:probable phosphoglycerate mutase